MKKKLQKKLFFVVVLLIVSVSLYGCRIAQKQNDNQNGANTIDVVYNGENLTLDGMDGFIIDIVSQYDRVGIVTLEWLDSEFTKKKLHFYVMNIDRNEMEEIPLTLSENGNLIEKTFDKNGNLIYITNSQDTDTYVYELIKVDRTGKELLRTPLHLNDNTICSLLVDEKNNIILAQPQAVSVFDEDFKCLATIEGDKEKDSINSIAFAKNGRVICSQGDYEGEKEILHVREIGNNPVKWENSYEIPITDTSFVDDILINGWGEYDFCYRTTDGIYGYIAKKKESVKLLDYTASNMTENHTQKITLLKEGEWIGMVYDEVEDTKVAVYRKVDPEIVANRKTLVVGVFGIEEEISEAIVQFNREHLEYQIEIRDYLEAEDPILQMNTEVIAGNAPDILDLSYVSMDQYIEKDLLENLTPYIERDSELSMQELIPSVSEVIEEEGHTYFVAPSFDLYSLAATKEEVGEKEGWTLEEMKDVLKKKDKDVNAFYWNDKIDLLYTLLEMNVSDFVDWSTGKCYFDGKEFRELLVLVEQVGTDGMSEYNEELLAERKAIRNGSVLFWEGCVNLAQLYMNRTTLGEDVTYVGYPNEDKEGSYFRFNHPFAICSNSKEKQMAWEFVRIFMTKEYQSKMDLYGNSMPTRQDCFDLMIEANLATEAYTNEMGQQVIPGALWSAYSMTYTDTLSEENPLTKKEAEELIALVGKTKRCVSYEDALMDIIQEEAEYYFAGEKSLEDTVKIIENRAETYVNENR